MSLGAGGDVSGQHPTVAMNAIRLPHCALMGVVAGAAVARVVNAVGRELGGPGRDLEERTRRVHRLLGVLLGAEPVAGHAVTIAELDVGGEVAVAILAGWGDGAAVNRVGVAGGTGDVRVDVRSVAAGLHLPAPSTRVALVTLATGVRVDVTVFRRALVAAQRRKCEGKALIFRNGMTALAGELLVVSEMGAAVGVTPGARGAIGGHALLGAGRPAEGEDRRRAQGDDRRAHDDAPPRRPVALRAHRFLRRVRRVKATPIASATIDSTR